MNRSLPLALFTLGAMAACQTTPPNPMTFNFNRPTGSAQVCVRVEVRSDGTFVTDSTGQIISTPEPHPLIECRTADSANTPGNASTNVPELPDSNGRYHAFRMFAVVSQSDRGELAVVNIHPSIGPPLIDNDPMIPGFTFIPVGAFPGAVVTHFDGSAIYVANTGENTISVVETASILRTQTAGSGSIAGVIRLSGRPSDLAIGRVDGHIILFATLPDLGDVVTIDVTDPTHAGTPQTIHLGARISGGLDGGTGGDGGTGDAGTTGTFRPERIAVSNFDRSSDGTLGDISRVYVTDSRSNYVHVLQAMSDGSVVEMTPLDAHTTTRPITVTPTVFSVDPPRRFIYVGGADDGALWVLDESTGERVPVNASQAYPACQQGTSTYDPANCPRIDAKISLYQMPIKSAVISLATVTRDAMDPGTCTTRVMPPTDSAAPSASNSSACAANTAYSTEGAASVNTIEGVAVIAGLRDSTLRIIDVEDWQAYCAPDRRAQSNQAVPLAQPHSPRNSVAYPDPGAANPYGLSTPAYTVNGALTSPSMDDPTLVSLDGTPCPEGQTCVFLPSPTGAPPADPRQVHDDTWSMTFEGPIPELTLRVGALQRVDGSTTDFHVEAPAAQFCTRGAVQGDIVTLADPSPCVQDPVDNDAGPRVLPDPSLCNGDAGADAGMSLCSQVFGSATAPCNRELTITSIDQDSIVMTPVPDQSSCSAIQITDAVQLSQLMQQCYPQAVLISIRPRNAWTVVSLAQGYVHSAYLNPSTGQCDQTTPNPGRAVENDEFTGVGFSTYIHSGARPTQRNAAYSFTISAGMTPLLLSGGLVPSTMFYSCPSRRLYFVDQSRASLVEYPIAPMSNARTFN